MLRGVALKLWPWVIRALQGQKACVNYFEQLR